MLRLAEEGVRVHRHQRVRVIPTPGKGNNSNMRNKWHLRGLARAGAAAIAIALCATAASAGTGPFTWPTGTSYEWCPNLHAYDGCSRADSQPENFQNDFDPAQVWVSGSMVSLTMNSNETSSGAFNESTYPLTIPFTVSETLNLPCNSSKKVYNWPAFWVDGQNQSPWPAGGEFDIAEGGGAGSAGGVLTYTYHYINPATGGAASITGTPGGSWCGSHTYKLHVTSTAATITWDSTVEKTITWSSAVPAPADDMEVIDDYGYSPTYAGPAGANQVMKVSNFSYAAS